MMEWEQFVICVVTVSVLVRVHQRGEFTNSNSFGSKKLVKNVNDKRISTRKIHKNDVAKQERDLKDTGIKLTKQLTSHRKIYIQGNDEMCLKLAWNCDSFCQWKNIKNIKKCKINNKV